MFQKAAKSPVLHPVSNDTLWCWENLIYSIKTVPEDADMPGCIVTLTNDEIQERKALIQKAERVTESSTHRYC